MIKSDPLFLLIKGLSQAEKRYFKVYTAKNSKRGKDYLRLFAAIEAQSVYDEKALRKKFNNEPYLKHLRTVKSYLHAQIMKVLRSFYDQSSVTVKLNNYLTEIEILFKKELYKNCSNTIKKAKICAEKFERFPHLLRIIEWEMRLVDYTGNIEPTGLLKQTTQPLKEVIADYIEIIDIQQVYFELRAATQLNGIQRSGEGKASFNKILQHPLLSTKLKSFRAEEYRLLIRLNHSLLTTDYNRMNKAVTELIEQYESGPRESNDVFNTYVKLLLTMAENCRLDGKYLAGAQIMQKTVQTCAKNHKYLSLAVKLRLMEAETELLLSQGEFEQAYHHLQLIHKLMEAEHKEITPEDRIFFYCLAFSTCFRNKDFKGAQYYIQIIINSNPGVSSNMQSSARISNLILQYEQNEFEHLSYVMQSTYRYLSKKQKLLDAEVIILGFLRKALKLTSQNQMLNALTELKTKILPHVNEPFIIGIPLIEWIDSKLLRKELKDVIKENYQAAIALEKSSEPAKNNVQLLTE